MDLSARRASQTHPILASRPWLLAGSRVRLQGAWQELSGRTRLAVTQPASENAARLDEYMISHAGYLVQLPSSLRAPLRCCPPQREWPAGPLPSAPPGVPATRMSTGREQAAAGGEVGEAVEAAQGVGMTGDWQQAAEIMQKLAVLAWL